MTNHEDMATATTRLEQLDYLSHTKVDGAPILIHGSVGHAAMMGLALPSEIKFSGIARDIDVYNSQRDKIELEGELEQIGIATPQPIDAGMASLLVHDASGVFASLDGITAELLDTEIFEEQEQYEVVGSDGVIINSFSPLGMLAVHRLRPDTFRFGHRKSDRQMAEWFADRGIVLPKNLDKSIRSFHDEYKTAYPKKVLLESAAEVYVHLLPESIRRKFRRYTHRFMRDHAGRITPFA